MGPGDSKHDATAFAAAALGWVGCVTIELLTKRGKKAGRDSDEAFATGREGEGKEEKSAF